MTYKPKAEVMFDAKMKLAVESRDFNAVAELFHWYGCYLQLVEPIQPPKTKALVHVPADEPTVHEEQMFVLSGAMAKFTREMQDFVRSELTSTVSLGMPQIRPRDDGDALYQPVIDGSKFPHYQPFIDKYTI